MLIINLVPVRVWLFTIWTVEAVFNKRPFYHWTMLIHLYRFSLKRTFYKYDTNLLPLISDLNGSKSSTNRGTSRRNLTLAYTNFCPSTNTINHNSLILKSFNYIDNTNTSSSLAPRCYGLECRVNLFMPHVRG